MKPSEPVVNQENPRSEDIFSQILSKVVASNEVLKEIKSDFSQLSKTVASRSTSINHLETQLGNISAHLN